MAIFVLDQPDFPSSEVAQKVGGELCVTPPDNAFFLCFENHRLIAKQLDGRLVRTIAPDFSEELRRLSIQKINPKKDLLCRALGFSGQSDYKIFDGTFGFGKDALHMVSAGAQVIGSELSPVVFALIDSELARNAELGEKLKVLFGDTVDSLSQVLSPIDVVYLDPMFEEVQKKSAPKKNLAFLRDYAVMDTDFEAIREASWSLGVKRLVVKRPLKSEHYGRKPQNMFRGKLIRYDVYLR